MARGNDEQRADAITMWRNANLFRLVGS